MNILSMALCSSPEDFTINLRIIFTHMKPNVYSKVTITTRTVCHVVDSRNFWYDEGPGPYKTVLLHFIVWRLVHTPARIMARFFLLLLQKQWVHSLNFFFNQQTLCFLRLKGDFSFSNTAHPGPWNAQQRRL